MTVPACAGKSGLNTCIQSTKILFFTKYNGLKKVYRGTGEKGLQRKELAIVTPFHVRLPMYGLQFGKTEQDKGRPREEAHLNIGHHDIDQMTTTPEFRRLGQPPRAGLPPS